MAYKSLKTIRNTLFISLAMITTVLAQEVKPTHLEYSNLKDIPTTESAQKSIGYAGMLGGIYQQHIIAAGGANFPDKMPWEGGAKVWHDQIFVYSNGQWVTSNQTLPEPLAYTANVSTEKGIYSIGGNNKNGPNKSVFIFTYDAIQKDVVVKNGPELPQPLANAAAVYFEGYIYLIGGSDVNGSTNLFYRLNLETGTTWEQLADFPGDPRSVHSAVVQDDSFSKKIYVIGGRNEQNGQKSKALSSFISYDLKHSVWEEEGPIEIQGKPRVIMGAAVERSGSMHILVYGGSDEKLFDQIENYTLKASASINDSIKSSLTAKKNAIFKNHPGFQKEVLAFNTMTDTWSVYDTLEDQIPITTLSFKANDRFYIVSGEVAPGVRTPKVYEYHSSKSASTFGWLNYAVIAGYFVVSLGIGLYFSYKQRSTNDYFVGGGRIPWWASGLSVFGTLLSAITFMAIPAKSFTTDWSFFFLNIAAIVVTPVIAYLFIPFFNKLKITTAYEFLEDRFNYTARAFGSLSFILFQLGRIGIVLLLPSLAISIVTGISVETSILIMGIICIVYTTFGGIEAVIWTDVFQVIILMGGSILAVIWILSHTEMPFGDMITYADAKEKFNVIDLSFNFTDSTFWVVFIGGLASAMVSQGTDQTIVQRYLTSSDLKDSRKTLYTNAVLTLPATIIFFGVGTLLFIFYTEMPERLSPGISNNDSIFPWYIVNELPKGISGLLIGGIFSAAMSSISSSLNSVSTAFCNDFYKRFNPKGSDQNLLKVARIATVAIGIFGIMFALWMANSNIKSLWDQFYKFLGLFTGGLGGMFLLGMLTKRANSKGVIIGLVLSALATWFVSMYTDINFLMYSLIGMVSCYVFGYLFSLLFKKPAHV